MSRFTACWIAAGLVSVAAGCQFKSALAGGGGGGPKVVEGSGDDRATASGPSSTVTVPDFKGMKRDEVIAAMKRAGFTDPKIDTDVNIACSDENVKHGGACYQSPEPGAQTLSSLSVTITFQEADPDSTTPGVAGAHYAMPNVVGLTIADVRKKLHAAGFSAKDRFTVLTEPTCSKPGAVCYEKPAAGEPTTTEFMKILYVGSARGVQDGDLFPDGQ